MSGRRFTLDTNILFYAMDKDAGSRHKLAMEIVDRASLSDCVIILQSPWFQPHQNRCPEPLKQ
ncbi:MAG: hypothetical protein JRF37_11825 [Deltaproteobacteria bacterium]|nr:hypothetical protein [Deltaproteobacteria bacterium]